MSNINKKLNPQKLQHFFKRLKRHLQIKNKDSSKPVKLSLKERDDQGCMESSETENKDASSILKEEDSTKVRILSDIANECQTMQDVILVSYRKEFKRLRKMIDIFENAVKLSVEKKNYLWICKIDLNTVKYILLLLKNTVARHTNDDVITLPDSKNVCFSFNSDVPRKVQQKSNQLLQYMWELDDILQILIKKRMEEIKLKKFGNQSLNLARLCKQEKEVQENFSNILDLIGELLDRFASVQTTLELLSRTQIATPKNSSSYAYVYDDLKEEKNESDDSRFHQLNNSLEVTSTSSSEGVLINSKNENQPKQQTRKVNEYIIPALSECAASSCAVFYVPNSAIDSGNVSNKCDEQSLQSHRSSKENKNELENLNTYYFDENCKAMQMGYERGSGYSSYKPKPSENHVMCYNLRLGHESFRKNTNVNGNELYLSCQTLKSRSSIITRQDQSSSEASTSYQENTLSMYDVASQSSSGCSTSYDVNDLLKLREDTKTRESTSSDISRFTSILSMDCFEYEEPISSDKFYL